MSIAYSTTVTDSLVNKGLSLNLRSINSRLSKLFQRYSIALNKITGNGLFGKVQTKQIQEGYGISKEYDKGQIVFKNGIDKLKFLIDNRESVAEQIGFSEDEIYRERRNLGMMQECLSRLDLRYELGTNDYDMQMYISMHDKNVGNLDEPHDWVEYILSQSWLDKLAERSVSTNVSFKDSKIEYLGDLVQRMVKEHELAYHQENSSFNPQNYLGKGTESSYETAMNKLNSFGKLGYGVYEMFKPIGGTTDRYIKVKLSSTQELDIQGTISLEDCTHVEWEHGSMDYLRSLDNDNQKYEFFLQLPICDLNSVIWHKLDEEEELTVSEDEDPNEYHPKYRYYMPYENEMLVRWLGTTYVPMFDPDTITKMTVCSTPKFTTPVQRESFFQDTDGIVSQIDRTDQLSDSGSFDGLSMFPTATIDLVQREDGQYLSFIVSGNQGTRNLTFHVHGQMMDVVDYMNRYPYTLEMVQDIYVQMTKEILFLELTKGMDSAVQDIWNMVYPGKDYIPQEWLDVQSQLEDIVWHPKTVDLMRLRNIDLESVIQEIVDQSYMRREFLLGISGMDKNGQKINVLNYLKKVCESDGTAEEANRLVQGKNFYNVHLDYYIWNYGKEDVSEHYQKIILPEDSLLEVVKTLDYLNVDRESEIYEISYETTVDELRDSIQEFNKLLPTLEVDSTDARIASRHIFLDWKSFVDKSIKYLLEMGLLFTKTDSDGKTVVETGIGTDELEHEYVEYYTNVQCTEPLIDYSYCIDDNGVVVADRFDYWTANDFN